MEQTQNEKTMPKIWYENDFLSDNATDPRCRVPLSFPFPNVRKEQKKCAGACGDTYTKDDLVEYQGKHWCQECLMNVIPQKSQI